MSTVVDSIVVKVKTVLAGQGLTKYILNYLLNPFNAKQDCSHFNPLTAGAAYIRDFLLAHQVPHFKYVKEKM